MQYYLLMPGDTEEDSLNEANLLGESSFGTFWGGIALSTLMGMVENEPELLKLVTIRTDMEKKSYSIEEFLTKINKLKIRFR